MSDNVEFGVERELAATVFGRRGRVFHDSRWLYELIEHVRLEVPTLPDYSGRGVFLANGGRLYIDCGHPEVCTPEVSSPDDLVAYLRAAEGLVWRAAQRLQSRSSPQQPFVGRGSVCYSSGTTFGAHETYTSHRLAHNIDRWLAPHLASRVIYTGAGGLECSNQSMRFVLSPRAMLICERARGPLVCTERRPVSRTLRCHVAAGEGVCSDLSLYLALGATALVIGALCHGGRPGAELRLVHPTSALSAFASDPTLRATVENEQGRQTTAWDVQWGYLKMVESQLGAPHMPSWAIETASLWRYVLEQLQSSRASLNTSLDWAIKEQLFRAEAARRGIDWEALQSEARQRGANSSSTVSGLAAMLRVRLRDLTHFGFEDAEARGEELNCDDPALAARSRERAAFCMLDTKFGELGEQGLFSQLDAAGCLNHRAVATGRIARAVVDPPSSPQRAQRRGRLVRQLSLKSQRYRVSWATIVDENTGRRLELDDERFDLQEWRPAEEETFETTPERTHAELLAQAQLHYEQGRYAMARTAIRYCERLHRHAPARGEAGRGEVWVRREIGQLRALVETRCGSGQEAELLQSLTYVNSLSLHDVNHMVSCLRFGRLCPDVEAMQAWIERGDQLAIPMGADRDDFGLGAFGRQSIDDDREQYDALAEHAAALWAARGCWDTARCAAEVLVRSHTSLSPARRLLACVTWGHACVALGRLEEAEHAWGIATCTSLDDDVMGERNEYLYPWLTALDDVPQAVRRLLSLVDQLDDLKNYVGALRCLFMAGRRARSTTLQSSIRQQIEGYLGDVPLWRDSVEVPLILARWPSWCGATSRASCLPGPEWFGDFG